MTLDNVVLIKYVAATAILIWAVVEDLRTRRFTNRSFLVASGIGLAIVIGASLYSGTWIHIRIALLGFLTGVIFFLPMVLTKIVGAGDMKLMAAVGIMIGWESLLWASLYAIIWAGIMGVLQVILKKQGGAVVQNLLSFALTQKSNRETLHYIPFTTPLFLGWMSLLVMPGGGFR